MAYQEQNMVLRRITLYVTLPHHTAPDITKNKLNSGCYKLTPNQSNNANQHGVWLFLNVTIISFFTTEFIFQFFFPQSR